ncbi:unnamed protein product [Heterobilharzia americana]|nr:unnamed protein product [Heterobilharzia americana]
MHKRRQIGCTINDSIDPEGFPGDLPKLEHREDVADALKWKSDRIFDSVTIFNMLSKSPTFHVPRSHIYEHERQSHLYHPHKHNNNNLTSNLSSNFKHNHQVSDSNMFRSEIIFNSKPSTSLSKYTTGNNSNNTNTSSISPTNSCFSISSIDNLDVRQQNDLDNNDTEYDDDINDGDYDDVDDDHSNKDDVDELFFIIPAQASSSSPHEVQVKQYNTFHSAVDTSDSGNSHCLSSKLPNLKDRITHTQNIWCLPNLSRSESEKLLKFAEIGNFIVRVNQQNSSMVLTRVCPPTTILRTSSRIREHFSGCGVGSNTKIGFLPIKHNLIEILPHDGYCLTGDKKMRLIFKSLIHLIEFYLRVQVSSRSSFLRLPMVICQAKTMEELEKYNKQGIEFWKSINNWNIDSFKLHRQRQLYNSKLSNCDNSMKASMLLNQKDGTTVVEPPLSSQQQERWRQMNINNNNDNNMNNNGDCKSVTHVRPRASSLNNRSTQKQQNEYKFKQKDIENIEKFTRCNNTNNANANNNNNRLNHTNILLETMKQRLDHRNNYVHNKTLFTGNPGQNVTTTANTSTTITTTHQKISPLNKLRANESVESTHQINQNRSHQNGVYEGAENEFWDVLLQAKSLNPVQTGGSQLWRFWDPNQTTKQPKNMDNTETNETTTNTTNSNSNNNNNTDIDNSASHQMKAYAPPRFVHTTPFNPSRMNNNSISEGNELTIPHEIVNSQDKKRQLKHQISLPAEKSQSSLDAYYRNSTDKATTQSLHINTGNAMRENKISDSANNITTVVTGDAPNRNINNSSNKNPCSRVKLPNYFTRIVDSGNNNNSVIDRDAMTNPTYLDGSFSDELTIDTKFGNIDEKQEDRNFTNQNDKDSEDCIDKILSDYDVIVDKDENYQTTRCSLKLDDLKELATPQTVGHVFVMKAKAYPIDDYNFLSGLPNCSATTTAAAIVADTSTSSSSSVNKLSSTTTPSLCEELTVKSTNDQHLNTSTYQEYISLYEYNQQTKLRRAYTTKKSSKRSQPYMELASDDYLNDNNCRRHGLLFLGESSTWLRNNILPTEEIDKITRIHNNEEGNTLQTNKTKYHPVLQPVINSVSHQRQQHHTIIYSERFRNNGPDSETSDITDTFVNHYNNCKKYNVKRNDHLISIETIGPPERNCFQGQQNSSVSASTETAESTMRSQTMRDLAVSECPRVTLLSAPRTPQSSDSHQCEQDAWNTSSNRQQHPTRQQISSDSHQNKNTKVESNASSPAASSRASNDYAQQQQSNQRNLHQPRKDSTFNRRKTLSSVEHQLWIEKLTADYNNYCSSCSITSTPPFIDGNSKPDINNLFWLWQRQQQQSSSERLKELSSTSLGNIDFLKKLQNDFDTTVGTIQNETEKPPPLPMRSRRGLAVSNSSNTNSNNYIDKHCDLTMPRNNILDFKRCPKEDFTDDISPYAVTACHSLAEGNHNHHNNNIDFVRSITEDKGLTEDRSLNTPKHLPLSSPSHTTSLNECHTSNFSTTAYTNLSLRNNINSNSNINVNAANTSSIFTTTSNTAHSDIHNNDSTTVEELLPYDYSSNRSMLFDCSQTSSSYNHSEFTKMDNNKINNSNNNSGKIWPDNYVYAQVLPKHLRGEDQLVDCSATQFRPDLFNALQNCELINLKKLENLSFDKNEGYTSGLHTGQCIAHCQQSKSTVNQNHMEVNFSTVRNKSLQSMTANQSKSDNLHHNHLQQQYQKSSERHDSADINRSSDLPRKSKKVGRYIKKFFHRLMTGSNSHIAAQINLFLECTKAGSERGPYRTMQSIRQFIDGMTNHLLKNPELGLPKAVEREREKLNEFGYVNVGFHLESVLQRFILKPLHYHVIKLLKQEQMKNADFANIRIKVQMLCNPQTGASDLGIQTCIGPPKESVVQYVANTYSRLENTYAVNQKIYNVKSDQEVDASSLTAEDLYAFYAWVFARSGLLLAPLIPDSHNPRLQTHTSSSIDNNRSVICPAALQADYLDGVLNNPQLNDQATGLKDLFGTLYWIWSDKALHRSCEPSPLLNRRQLKTEQNTSSPLMNDKQETQFFNRSPPLRQQQPIVEGSTSSGYGLFHSTVEITRRRIIPPRRRKTVTGVNLPKVLKNVGNPSSNVLRNGKASTIDLKVTGAKQLSPLSKPQSISHLTLNEDHSYPTPTNNNVSPPRWRPWIGQSTLTTRSTNTLCNSTPPSPGPNSVQSNTDHCLQVLVMNEETSQLQVLNYPIRPNMTARELNNLIAFQMRIFDSKDFGLFAYINGTEIQLEDELRMAEFTGANSDVSHSVHTLPMAFNTITTTPSRSKAGTLNSLRDPESLPFRSHISISSRSDSTTSSSSESRSHHTISRRIRKSSRNRPAWWVMCGSNGQTKHHLVGSVQNPPCTESTGQQESLVIHKPVLVYRRKSGYFALSDRLLVGLKSLQQQNPEQSFPIIP